MLFWPCLLIVLAVLFYFYLTGFGVAPAIIGSILLGIFIILFFPLLGTTFFYPFIIPFFTVLTIMGLFMCSPLISSLFIPILTMFAIFVPIFGVPFFSQMGVLLFILIAIGILLAIFGSPIIATSLL